MSQSGPTWIFDDYSTPAGGTQSLASTDVHMLDYGIAELTTENGQLALHRSGDPRASARLLSSASAWEKPRATTGTLESLVKHATRLDITKSRSHTVVEDDDNGRDYSTPCVDDHRQGSATNSPAASSAMRTTLRTNIAMSTNAPTTRVVVGPTLVGSCTGSRTTATVVSAEVAVATRLGKGCNKSGGDTFEKERHRRRVIGAGCSVTSSRSRYAHEVGEGKQKKKWSKKMSISNKRSRADNVRNLSERTRRNRINQRLKILQKLIPDCSKTDKASVLDEAITHIKQLETQIHMTRKMYLCPMTTMMPNKSRLATNEHFFMPIMPPNIPYVNNVAFSPLLPNPFMQVGLPSIMPYFNLKTQYTA